MFGDLPDSYPNRSAFLDMIAWAEIGPELLAKSDNGYNVLVGSTPNYPLLFTSYADHPRVLNIDVASTAAGRYQILERWWDAYKVLLDLPDFSPTSQDAVAMRQIYERGALSDIDDGNIASAIQKCSNIWASLPGNTYGQHQQKLDDLIGVYSKAGGSVLT